MSLPVLIGFAGVLVAAVATGLLAGRCVRQPRIEFVLWTAATLGLTIALAAQSMGFSGGFGPVTFRAVQLFALLLAPLWLAWGLVELVAANEAARFGMRLISAALTVVASVILATDPLSAQPFSKAWPLTGPHFQPVSHYALDAVQVFAAVTVVAVVIVAGAGRGSRPPAAAVASVGLAALMTAALRFPLPARAAYPLLTMVAAALVWFGVSRVGEPPRRAAGGDGVREGRRDRVREGRGRYRSGDGPEDDYWPDDAAGPAGGYLADDRYATFGPRGDLPAPGRSPGPGDFPAARSPNGGDRGRRGPSGPQPWGREGRDWSRGSGPAGPESSERPAGRAPGSAVPGSAVPGAGLAAAESGPQASPGGSQAAAPARPYGRILIFTLLDDRVADFDRLAEQTAEEVRTGEPDTLVYVIHTVPNAPMQRIFYEIYRDRAAFDRHESQPYMQRFVADRRSYVLATNVIELRLKYAKVAPLPSPQAPAPAAAASVAAPAPAPAGRAQLPGAPPQLPGGPRQLPGGPRQLPGGPPQRQQPLPPGRRHGGG
jgi:quinol monooxygenase YgiN